MGHKDSHDEFDREPCRLYLITPPKFELASFVKSVEAAFEGGRIDCLQLRMKDAADDEIIAVAQTLLPLAHKNGTPLVLNDSPELAVQVGADGVHIGRNDTPFAEARRIVGNDRIVGVSCYDDQDLAITLGEAGADYVAFGAFFDTTTKEATSRADVEILQWWNMFFTLPSVAIGGITVNNCTPLVEAGVDFIAAVSGVWDHSEGPAAAVAHFNRIFEAHSPTS